MCEHLGALKIVLVLATRIGRQLSLDVYFAGAAVRERLQHAAWKTYFAGGINTHWKIQFLGKESIVS
jgi:hypothetical protein